tara:strand:+ start:2085 stop:2291 length:207 start_codon:yes stop_codon:yes gene_type:complete
MKKAETLARRECANYNGGKCLGVMFARINGKLTIKVDGDFAGKECIANSSKCGYFNHVVVRGVHNANF